MASASTPGWYVPATSTSRLSGAHHHGAEFVQQAAQAGAVAILTDAAGGQIANGVQLPVIVVDQPRQAMAGVAATIYGRPADALTMCAVTGTNGKTTTTFLLEAALRAGGVSTGSVGTVGFRLNGVALDCIPTTVTTPESTDLQGLLAFLLEEGAETVMMEVSSHALVLGRADAITFDVAAFTNLGRDHLDFHGDMESYFEAKASLFTPERTRHAVINVDDPRGRELVQRIGREAGIRLTTVKSRRRRRMPRVGVPGPTRWTNSRSRRPARSYPRLQPQTPG